MSGKQDKFIGKAKETVGKLTNNEKLEAEGRAQHVKGEVKEKFGKAGDVAEGTAEGLREEPDRKSE